MRLYYNSVIEYKFWNDFIDLYWRHYLVLEPDLKEAPSDKLNHIHGSGDNNTTILNSNNEKQVKNRANNANLQNYLP